jgi:hypothetical protein
LTEVLNVDPVVAIVVASVPPDWPSVPAPMFALLAVPAGATLDGGVSLRVPYCQ